MYPCRDYTAILDLGNLLASNFTTPIILWTKQTCGLLQVSPFESLVISRFDFLARGIINI